MPLRTAEIVELSRSEAAAFIAQFEHLGNVGLGVWHRGLLIRGVLGAVLSFGTPCLCKNRGVLGAIASKYKLRLIQLCRGATADWAPKNTPSRAVSLALRDLQQEFGPLLVVCYADPKFGEVGTIYQACNAICTGWTNPKGQADYIINGERLSAWNVRKRYGTRDRRKLKAIHRRVVVRLLKPKIRYVFVAAPHALKCKVLQDLQPIAVEYPRRISLGIQSMEELGLRSVGMRIGVRSQ